MSDEDYKKEQIHHCVASFADMLSNLRKEISKAEMLENMVIYNTGKTKREIETIYRTYIGKCATTIFPITDETYMEFLSDYIDCNFDIDALMAINEL